MHYPINRNSARKKKHKILYWILGITLIISGCRKPEIVYPSIETSITNDTCSGGLFVLNEGNMGSNKAQIDYMDFTSGIYTRNIYGSSNPDALKELGDVGNDIQMYGGKLYAVINCSHKVEVMDCNCHRRGQIDIPNCRCLAFNNGKMYVSAYVGSIMDAEHLGAVYEVDTTTLLITREVEVGHQPEHMAIADGKLYVTNSGGYRVGVYDSTVSVVDIASMTEIKKIPVRKNPNHIIIDSKGRLWINCRGDYNGEKGSLIVVANDEIIKRFELQINNMSYCGHQLYLLSAKEKSIRVIDTESMEISETNISIKSYEMPYGLLATEDKIFVTDAKNYVSSGMLYAYDKTGKQIWKAQTGDIPGHLCLNNNTIEIADPIKQDSCNIHVLDYMPAMGQFVNELPKYESGDTREQMNRKAEESLRKGELISLGGWGGQVTLGFEKSIKNEEGYDFRILGNAFLQTGSTEYGSSEPGIVMVSFDTNKNGKADDTWYELAGSEYYKSETNHHYSKTYSKASDTLQNPFHQHPYYPQWITEDKYTLTGELLATHPGPNGTTSVYQLLDFGYADNRPNNDTIGTSFDIDWAVDSNGNPIKLTEIHFIRIYTGVDETDRMNGEVSTEISGIEIIQP